jgi:hypothetical protein
MSTSPSHSVSSTSVTLLLLLGLATGFFAVLRPAARDATEIDRTLTNLWHRLILSNETFVACAGVTPDNYQERLAALNQTKEDVSVARRLIEGRIHLPTNVIQALDAPFQLLDFQRVRQETADRLAAEAGKFKVKLHPGATNGLPHYTAEIADPSILWVRLFLSEQTLRTAVHCRVKEVRLLQQLPSPGPTGVDGYFELPVLVELAGDLDAVARLLSCLPLRGEEFDRVGLPVALTNKPALFVGRILLRKSAPNHPREVLVEMVVSGFVPIPRRYALAR